MVCTDFSKASARRTLKRDLSRQTVLQAAKSDLPDMLRKANDIRVDRQAGKPDAPRVEGQRGFARMTLLAERGDAEALRAVAINPVSSDPKVLAGRCDVRVIAGTARLGATA